jgi:hypothetical protein
LRGDSLERYLPATVAGEDCVSRRVKEFIEISDFASLDDLIARLEAVRDSLPPFAEAELRMKGDDVFGRKLSISFMRDQNGEEADYEQRYAEVIRAAQEQALDKLQQELGVVCRLPTGRKRRAA